MYKDNDVAREAFKAGEFDFYKEYSARAWARLHKGPKWDDGRIKKDPFPTGFGQYLQSYQLNMRLPKFQDRRVREALTYTYDFEMTINRYGQYARADSMFNNSIFAAQGLPSPAELKLLEPFRKELPPEVFGPAYVAPRTNGDPKLLRQNLLKARDLFAAAGWKVAADGRLRNAQGEAFEVEYLTAGDRSSTLPEWRLNFEKLGATLRLRSVDLRAVPAPTRGVRLRHGDDRRRPVHAAVAGRAHHQLRQQGRRREGQQQLSRHQERGGRSSARRHGRTRPGSTTFAMPRARSTGS